MAGALEPILFAVLLSFVAGGWLTLRRADASAGSYWIAGWVSAAASGVLVLLHESLPRLQLLAHPLGSLFPFLLVSGALALGGRRVPAWLPALGLALGVVRAGIAALGHVTAAYAVGLALEPAVVLAAGWIAWRACPEQGATLGQRLLGPSFVVLAAVGVFHLAWLTSGRTPEITLPILWMLVAPPALVLQVYASSEKFRQALRLAHEQLEHRVEERTAELARANAALRQSEERYRTVSELSSDFSFALRIDRELRLSRDWVTGAFRRITGADPEELDGHGWISFVDQEMREQLPAEYAAAGIPPRAGVTTLRAIRTRSGDLRWLEVRVHTARSAQDGSLHLVGSARDVTEEQRVAEERQVLARRMQDAERLESLGRLSGGIAHDFNNLLSVILGNSRLALSELPPGSPAAVRIERIRSAGEHAARLTEQMLIYGGRASLDRKVVDLSRLVRDMLDLVRASLESDCRLETHLEEGILVEADETQLRQVVLNLVSNASEALEEGGGRVDLRVVRALATAQELAGSRGAPSLEPGTCALVEVSDSGRGMDTATRQRLFEPFFTTKFTGRGLGLATVLGIVRSHGGVVGVESVPGQGTSVRVLLPLSAAAEERSASTASRTPAGGGGERVLLVDDDLAVLEVAQAFLTRAGVAVTPALGGRQAIELFRAQPDAFDAVVLDLAMPDVGGDVVFRALRELRPDVPVVLTTGYSEELAARRFTTRGRCGFLRKPYEPEELMERLRAALAERG